MFTWGILPLCLLLTWVINEVKMHYHWNIVYPLSVKSSDNIFQYIPSGVMEKDDALYRIKECKDRYERIKRLVKKFTNNSAVLMLHLALIFLIK